MAATNGDESKVSKKNILLYNKMWDLEFPDFSKLNIPDFELLTESEFKYRALLGDSQIDVIVFHLPSLELKNEELLKLKKSNQLWVWWTMECMEHFPRFCQPEITSLFDIKCTYELDADVSTPYIDPNPDVWRCEPVEKKAFINAFFSSNWDLSGRYEYLSKLMSHLDIHSYGKILNNQKLEQDPYFINGKVSYQSLIFKKEVIPKYKFSLAFENAIAKDYVTEKFFHPLQVGSVPVYLGAPNVAEFAPGDKCYIDVNSFSSVKQLADYLLLLDSNDDLYNEYLKWKKLPFRNEFESKINKKIDPLEKLLTEVRKRL